MANRKAWTVTAVRSLGVCTDVETAGSIFGLSRTQSYEALRRGEFPVPVVRIGRRIKVPTAPLRQALVIDGPGTRSRRLAADGGGDDAA